MPPEITRTIHRIDPESDDSETELHSSSSSQDDPASSTSSSSNSHKRRRLSPPERCNEEPPLFWNHPVYRTALKEDITFATVNKCFWMSHPSSSPPQQHYVVSRRRTAAVSFQPTVQVQTIPSHRDYSSAIRQTLWTGLRELQANAARNELEFAADGDDWRLCQEEESFQIWFDGASRSGRLVHPATFQENKRKQHQQQQQLAEQQQKNVPIFRPNKKRKHVGMQPLRRIAKAASLADLSAIPSC